MRRRGGGLKRLWQNQGTLRFLILARLRFALLGSLGLPPHTPPEGVFPPSDSLLRFAAV